MFSRARTGALPGVALVAAVLVAGWLCSVIGAQVALILVALALLVVGIRQPSALVFLAIVTSIDRVQSSFTVSGFTVFQGLVGILVLAILIRNLAHPGSERLSVPDLAPAFLLLCGWVLLPAAHSTAETVVLLATNLLRVVMLAVIMFEASTAWKRRQIVLAIEILATIVSLGVIVAYVFPVQAQDLGGLFYEHGAYARSLGLERDPNYAALKILIAMPLPLARIARAQLSRGKLLLSTVQLAIMAAAVLCTGSRAGLLTMLLLLVLWLAVNRRSRRVRAFMVGLTVVVVLQGEFASVIDRLRLSLIPGTSQYLADIVGRQVLIQSALSAFADSPLWGTGPLVDGYHNTYLDVISFYGLIGTAGFGCAVICAVRRQMLAAKNALQSPSAVPAYALLLSLAACGAMGISIGVERELLFWVALALALTPPIFARVALTGPSHMSGDPQVVRG